MLISPAFARGKSSERSSGVEFRKEEEMEGRTVLEILDPTGDAVAAGKVPFAKRLDTIQGKRVGLVWNGKPGADRMLDFVEDLLHERFPKVETHRFVTSNVANQLKPGELEGIAGGVDAVIYASGD
jgi:hypothetical protein